VRAAELVRRPGPRGGSGRGENAAPSLKPTVRPLINSEEQEIVVFLWRKSVLLTPFSDTRCSKRPDFSPAQPWRLFHPPALSLPRQPLRPGTRLVPGKAAASYRFIYQGWLG
jgi:hypothetical protein